MHIAKAMNDDSSYGLASAWPAASRFAPASNSATMNTAITGRYDVSPG